MPGTPRIYAANAIQRGPSDLWLGVTLDAATGKVTLAADGTPDSTANPGAKHFGLLAVPSVLTYTPKPDFDVVDQDTAPVAAFANTEELGIEVTLSQLQLNAVLAHCMPAGVFSDSASEGITVGLGGDILLAPVALAVVAPSSDPAYKWAVATLRKAIPMGAIKLELGRSKSATYQAQFKGLSDLTVAGGARLGAVYKTL